MSSWFRIHSGMCEDAKFRAVSRNADVTVATVIAIWVYALDDASNPSHRGVVTRNVSLFSVVLEIEEEVIRKVWAQFEALEMISAGERKTITNWGKRQFESDQRDPTGAIRQKRFRERHGQESKTNGAVMRNGHETERNTQNRTEQNRNARAREDARTKWASVGDRLIAKVGPDVFDRKFGPCALKLGPPIEIEAPTRFWGHDLQTRYGTQILEALGNDAVVTWQGRIAT